MKLIKSFLLAFAIITVSTNIGFSQSANTAQQVETGKTSTINVKGVTCSKDVTMISDNVKKLKGVNSCEVVKKGATSKFKVKFDPALVTEKQIHTAIEGTACCKDPNARPYKVKL